MLFHKIVLPSRSSYDRIAKWIRESTLLIYIQHRRKTSMGEAKSIIWAGFDVGKASFVAALDEATASERRKVTSLPCREFKRNQDEVKKFFR